MNKLLISLALIALAGSALAQDAMTVVKPETLTWKEHPIFKGAQTAILLGDPTKAEVVVQRVKFPVRDAIDQAGEVVNRELRSVTDNPVVSVSRKSSLCASRSRKLRFARCSSASP